MRKIFTISDTHFGHENILKFTDDEGAYLRHFDSVEDMNDCMVTRWNETVSDQDIIYHLGDVYFGKGWECLKKLKGRKRLLLGNHDNGKAKYLQEAFQKIGMWRMFPELNLVLSHVPIIIPETAKFEFNVHGHIHGNKSPTPFHINVSAEAVNYTPVDIESLIKGEWRDRQEKDPGGQS
jgi:calcineurin-like phosphoesterase family protein